MTLEELRYIQQRRAEAKDFALKLFVALCIGLILAPAIYVWAGGGQ